jgi:alpha-beta hydrolase superfamily lysophospholipase
MALHDERAWIAGVPVRLVHQGNPWKAGDQGTILFAHGLGAEIAGQTKELYSLAEAGFLVVGMDAPGHGVRRWPDFEERFDSPRAEQEETFLTVLREGAEEIPRLLDQLIQRDWSREDRLGMGGISMGGFLAYYLLPREPRIRVLTPILGSPRWDHPDPESPHLSPGAFPPVAVLSQNAGADHNVPPGPARDFHERLRPLYQQAGMADRERYVEFPDCQHFMPEKEWNRLWGNVVEWYLRHLS